MVVGRLQGRRYVRASHRGGSSFCQGLVLCSGTSHGTAWYHLTCCQNRRQDHGSWRGLPVLPDCSPRYPATVLMCSEPIVSAPAFLLFLLEDLGHPSFLPHFSIHASTKSMKRLSPVPVVTTFSELSCHFSNSLPLEGMIWSDAGAYSHSRQHSTHWHVVGILKRVVSEWEKNRLP